MHHHRRRDHAPPRRPQPGQSFARIALATTIAIAVLSAGVLVFRPSFGLSVNVHGARAWSAPSKAAQPAATSAPAPAPAPVTRLARRDTGGP